MQRKALGTIFPLFFGMSVASCAGSSDLANATDAPAVPVRDTHEVLNGVLWTQTAAEYEISTVQAYELARLRLDEALSDPSWTAATEQIGLDVSALPPAIILDVDETVLDNSPFEGQRLLERTSFSPENWTAWVERAEAPAVPGARDFLEYAAARSVAIFYVTNRDAPGEAATLRNLQAAGMPVAADSSTLHMRGEREEWGSDKTTRRAAVAETHRILLLFGDDLNDFVSGVRGVEPSIRKDVAGAHSALWGSGWIMLPNPVYGSWERSTQIGAEGDASGLAAKRRHLRGYGDSPVEQ